MFRYRAFDEQTHRAQKGVMGSANYMVVSIVYGSVAVEKSTGRLNGIEGDLEELWDCIKPLGLSGADYGAVAGYTRFIDDVTGEGDMEKGERGNEEGDEVRKMHCG